MHKFIIFLLIRVIPLFAMIFPFFQLYVKLLTIFICTLPLIFNFILSIKVQSLKVKLPPLKTNRAHKGVLYLGTVKSNIIRKKFYLSDKDLQKHMFITGLTGMGKSNMVKHILKQIMKNYPHLPFLVLEFKGEYQEIAHMFKNVTVFRPGESLKINIFNPRGEDPKIHAEKLLNMLTSCQIVTFQEEFSSQMEKIFVEILYAVCSDPKRRSWDGFDYYMNKFQKENQAKYFNLNNSLFSIDNRIRRLKSGPLRSIFDEELNLDIKMIQNSKIIIDLSSIIHQGGTKNDAVFFSNVLFNHLWLYNIKQGPSSEINHFTLIEDSQFLLSQKLTKKMTSTSYLEDFALLLRGTGECLITINTRPTISEDVMANAGVIISFQINFDQSLMGKLLGLKDTKYHYLATLDVGECIIKTNSFPTPFMVKVPYIHD